MKVLNLIPLIRYEEIYEKFKNDELLTISPFLDENLGKSIRCEIGSLNYVLALICQILKPNCEFFNSLDTAYLSGESSVGEEEIEEIYEFLDGCECILVDENLLNFHEDRENIKGFLGIISQKTGAKIISDKNKGLKFEAFVKGLNEELGDYDGSVIYTHQKDDEFVGGVYFMAAARIKDGDIVSVKTPYFNVKRKFRLDKDIKGTVAFFGFRSEPKNLNHYAFLKPEISKTKG
ncbi:MAG: hypothetical protein MR902_08275 [Campylobacter sp.]|nr:hypothetical protein [Campylobacter sp.]